MSADPTFWNNVAEKYAASPVDNPDAFDRKTEITLSHLTPESTVSTCLPRWFVSPKARPQMPPT
jgi:hypothetical protein